MCSKLPPHRQRAKPGQGTSTIFPLTAPDSIRIYDDLLALARGVVDLVDDPEAANRMQTVAYETCADKFDWEQRGRLLLAETAVA